MRVKDIMSKDPECCTPDTPLVRVAQMMKEADCGAIPVVRDQKDKAPLGVITDRDIVVRAVAEGKNPAQARVKDCFTANLVTVNPDADIEECIQEMISNKVRRVIVVDGEGRCCGIVVQAQIVRHASKDSVMELLQEISQPSEMVET